MVCGGSAEVVRLPRAAAEDAANRRNAGTSRIARTFTVLRGAWHRDARPGREASAHPVAGLAPAGDNARRGDGDGTSTERKMKMPGAKPGIQFAAPAEPSAAAPAAAAAAVCST